MNLTGKQARAANNDEAPRVKHDEYPAHRQQDPLNANMAGASGQEHGHNHAGPSGGHDDHNRGVGPRHASLEQTVVVKSKSKRVPEDNIAKLVAEESASSRKFPKYPGLERWELVEKMGDGAFSNVYRARDLEGTAGEVAIKVVRKFEMNSMQVRV